MTIIYLVHFNIYDQKHLIKHKGRIQVSVLGLSDRLITWSGKSSGWFYKKNEWDWFWSYSNRAMWNSAYVQLKQLTTRFVNDYPGYDGTISFLKNVTSAYVQLQLRKIKDNHPAHNHHAAHQWVKKIF